MVADLGAALIAAGAPGGVLAGTIVPVPPAPLRLARRGFDPARELAERLSDRSGLPLADSLRRRDHRPQRGRSRARRLRSPPRFGVAGHVPESALLVDDVATTGATLDACAGALRRGGAIRVAAVALAAVPPPPRSLRITSPAA